MRIFKYKNADEWESNIKNTVSPKYFRANHIIGTALNIAVPAAILFGLKADLMTYILCFIGFDIGMSALDGISLGLYKGGKSIKWFMNKGKFSKQVKNMSLDEINRMKDEMGSNSEYFNEKLEVINACIEEYKQAEQALVMPGDKDTIKYVESIINRLRAYSYDSIPFDECDECIGWIQEETKEIVQKSDNLIEIVKKSPDKAADIVRTFNVYADELLNIILKYQESDEEQQQKMAGKLKNLLDTFSEKLERLTDKITTSREYSLNMDIDYLSKRLNEDIKAEGSDGNV